jgi:hypothetical protein
MINMANMLKLHILLLISLFSFANGKKTAGKGKLDSRIIGGEVAHPRITQFH